MNDVPSGVCPKCKRVLDDHQWFKDGDPLPRPICP